MATQLIPFGLYVNISTKKLDDEFEKRGISGESTQEIILFKEPNGHREILIPEKVNGWNTMDSYDKYGINNEEFIPLHEVILANKEYALIRKNFRGIDQFGSINRNSSFYFCGINDEGKYFIRPLKNFPLQNYEKPNINDIANWVNRVDEEFDIRIQGDVLAKFVNKMDTSLEAGQKSNRVINRGTALESALTPRPTFFSAPNRPQLGLQDVFSRTRSRTTDEHIEIEVEGIKYSQISDLPLKLGNHKLFTEGKVYASTEMPFICVLGTSLILQHHEHAIKELVIPEKCVIVLAAQRGRDFDLKDLNYLKKAYD